MLSHPITVAVINCFSLALGAAGVRWSEPEYRWIFECIVYLSVAAAVVLIVIACWSGRGKIKSRIRMIDPWHIIAVGLAIAVCGVLWQQTRGAPTKTDTTVVGSTPLPSDPKIPATSNTFSASTGGIISAKKVDGIGVLPSNFARADTGGQIILDGSKATAVPRPVRPDSDVEYPPRDGTYKNLSDAELSERLRQSAKMFREASNREQWTSLALDARELCSEAFPRTGVVASKGNGSFLLLTVYIREKAAAEAVSDFLETVAVAVREKKQ